MKHKLGITALICLGGVEPMLKSHLGIALHLGMTEAQLGDLMAIVEAHIGVKEAEAGRRALAEVVAERGN